jgi:hypothetical protein
MRFRILSPRMRSDKMHGKLQFFSATMLAVLLCACNPHWQLRTRQVKNELPRDKPATIAMLRVREDAVIEPRTEADKKRTAWIDAQLRAIGTLQADTHTSPVVFARVDNQKDPIRVADPEKSQSKDLIVLWLNKDGRIVVAEEIPWSESGDWYNTYTHYFDDQGRTIAFERYSGFFSPERKENSIYYFDSMYRLIKKTYKLTNFDGSPARKPADDELYYHFKYWIYPLWASMAKEISLPINPAMH